MITSLRTAFRLGDAPRLSLVGAGGKSISLFRLAREYKTPVLLGCTAHLSLAQADLADRHVVALTAADIAAAAVDKQNNVTLFTGADNGKGRWSSLPQEVLPALRQLAEEWQVPLLFESDGSRCLPLKAWGEHEPPVPAWVDTVVVCSGLSGLGAPLDEAHVFRAETFSMLSALPLNKPVTPDALAAVLAHPAGGLKNIPAAARRICLLNQADDEAAQAQAQQVALKLQNTYSSVVVTALKDNRIQAVFEPAAGVVLAAGGARRMGEPKLLLEWHGQPIIRHTVRCALDAGLSPVVVVTGAHAAGVEQALSGLPVRLVHNPDWQAGQSTSVKAGLAALPPETGAAAFLLGDQPQIPPQLVQALVQQHYRTLAPVTCPLIDRQRGNPVLFDRVTFADFMQLQGDAGARQILSKYPLDYLPWHDASLLLDVDTPEDYARLQGA